MDSEHSWGIILAGGEGHRLERYTKSIYGFARPKQYAAIIGNSSMLQQTLDRVKWLLRQNHILTIVNSDHRQYVQEQLRDQPPETVIIQPFCRDTGPGILLPLLQIHNRDHDAVAAIFPSDHFILEEHKFMAYVAQAFTFVRSHPNYLAVLGITPEYPDTEYGWIEKGDILFRLPQMVIHRVRRFWEKPSAQTAARLQNSGCLWNTLVIVGLVMTFLEQFQNLLPEVYEPFAKIREVLGSPQEAATVQSIFTTLPSRNFSKSILEKIPDRLCVIPIEGVYWSDWGDEHRIKLDAERLGLTLSSFRTFMKLKA